MSVSTQIDILHLLEKRREIDAQITKLLPQVKDQYRWMDKPISDFFDVVVSRDMLADLQAAAPELVAEMRGVDVKVDDSPEAIAEARKFSGI